MENFVTISGCSGGGKSTLLSELRRRGFATIDEPGRRIVADELKRGGRQTAHRIFAGERWTTLHGVNADFCHALAPLGELFAGSKMSRLI